MEHWDLGTEILNVVIAIVSFLTGFFAKTQSKKTK